MNGYSIINKKPSIVCLNQRLITKLGANYYSIRKIEMVEKIINSTEDNKALGSLVKTKEKRMKPKGKDSIYIGLANINSDTGEIEVNTVDEANIEGTSVIIEAGDILFSKLRPNLNKVAICPKYIGNALGSTEFVVMESKNIDKYFLYSVLKSNVALKQVIDITTGSTLPRIDSEDVLNILVPIPSPEIQKYIGDKVRRAEELREEAKRLKEEAESLISNSINLERLVEKVRDYKSKNNWVDSASISGRIDGQYYINPITEINKYMKNIDMKLVVLRDIAEVRKGFSYSNESSNGVPYIRISDLDDLLIDYSKVVRIDNKTYQQKRNSQLKYFDLIMAITGATIGKVSVFYNKEIEKATLSADTAYVRFNNIEDSIAYLLYFKTVIGQLAITQGITGATNKHLAIEDIKNIVLPQFEDSIKKEVKNKIVQSMDNIYTSKQLIQEAKQDVEDLIEGKFDTSKLNNDSSTESRC
jgi:type I restriction enzyme S subunit